MNIRPEHIDLLRQYGYTEPEARFIYLVATHSGYFTQRQFLKFVGAQRGKRLYSFLDKMFRNGHGREGQLFKSSASVYHLFSRRLYASIGKENLRNRRLHSVEFAKARLVLLDFILENLGYEYLETETDKVSYFLNILDLKEEHLPAKHYKAQGSKSPTTCYFVDKFPIYIDPRDPPSPPVVTFTYVDAGSRTLAGFQTHLRAYGPLFSQLPSFKFVYLSNHATHFSRAARAFFPIGSRPHLLALQGGLARYFRLSQAWERQEHSKFSPEDFGFLGEARGCFRALRIECLYQDWLQTGKPWDSQLEAITREQTSQMRRVFSTYLVGGKPRNGKLKVKSRVTSSEAKVSP